MDRGRSSSSRLRYCIPSYYLKRPKRLSLFFIAFVCVSWVFWDRQTLFRQQVVGGLLSAYDLSGDIDFLDKVRDIADRLLPARDTPSGILYNIINLAHGRPHNSGWTGI